MAAVKLSKNVIQSFIDSFDTILVDCDGLFIKKCNIKLSNWISQIFSGVLWAGSKLIHHSMETINFLKENGKRVFYVTNNSTKTRSQYLTRLLEIGYNAEEVFHLAKRHWKYIQTIMLFILIRKKLLHLDFWLHHTWNQSISTKKFTSLAAKDLVKN